MEEIEDIIAASEEDTLDLRDDEDPREDTWIIEDGSTAVKMTDRHVFLYRESVLPEKIQAFFSLADLQPGKKRKIVFWQENHRFDAFIEKTMHDPPLTRLRWNQDFALLLKSVYPEWFEYFKKSRSESDDTPSLFFSRRPVPDEYDVAFEGAVARNTSTDFEVPVRPGDVIDNDTLRGIFRCSTQGSMRRSQQTNSLVLVSDHTRPACSDRWIGKTFHFTGMGLSGEQGLTFNQNKALCESNEKGTGLFLFEVFEPGTFTYRGEVELADNPYLSRQTDNEKNTRDVTVFPLKLRGGGHPPLPEKGLPEIPDDIVHNKEQKFVTARPGFTARDSPDEECKPDEISDIFDNDQIVSEYAKRRADGLCQLCNLPAPFKNRDGEPYLEIHHIVPLAEGGQDIIENVAALCPNCHRKMHELNLPADVVRLRNRVSSRD